jgi:hypothetical protein
MLLMFLQAVSMIAQITTRSVQKISTGILVVKHPMDTLRSFSASVTSGVTLIAAPALTICGGTAGGNSKLLGTHNSEK